MPSLTTPIHFQQISKPHLTQIKNHLLPPNSLNLLPLKKRIATKKRDHRLVPHGTKKPSENDCRAREPFDILYDVIKDQNLGEFSELLGDEYKSFRYLPFIMKSLIRRKQALAMLSSLMAFVVNGIEFVIKPTAQGGADVGIKWRFEWKKSHISLGPVCSLDASNVCTGKILLRKGSAFIEPLFHTKSLRLMMEETVMPILEKIVPKSLRGKRKEAFLNCLLSLLSMVICLILWKNTSM